MVVSNGLVSAADDTRGKAKGLDLRVVDKATGEPVEGGAVETRADRVRANATTDADGRCRLALPEKAPGYFAVWLKKDGYVSATAEWRGEGGRGADPPA